MQVLIVPNGIEHDGAGFDKVVKLSELDSLSQSVTVLEINNILDTVPNRDELLKVLLSKLRYGGRIILNGTDIDNVTQALVSRAINIEEASQRLYDGRMSCSSANAMIEKLTSFGIKITKVKFNQFDYMIVAERSKPNG